VALAVRQMLLDKNGITIDSISKRPELDKKPYHIFLEFE